MLTALCNNQNDIYSRITNQIITAIEADTGDWKIPWHTDGLNSMKPINATNGQSLSGRVCFSPVVRR